MFNSVRDLLIAWSLLPWLTPNRVRLMLEWFDPLEKAVAAPSSVLVGLLNIDEAKARLVKNPLQTERVASLRDSVVTLIDADYPPLLRSIIDPPLVLHVRGCRELLSTRAVALVGSRRASPYGTNVARHLARRLSHEAGLTIVSGLARGIDTAAHAATVDAGGATIAVLGTGIDVVYPRSNQPLFDTIAERGLIVSEFPPGTLPVAMNFPIRNRLISGLSEGTVIVEATDRSGSLITARMAAEQGREVFAVPGSIFNKSSVGTHRLIQYGAKLVHDAEDIVEELRDPPALGKQRSDSRPPRELQDVFDVLNRDDAVHVETAVMKTGRSLTDVSAALLQLELGGWIEARPGSRYVRVK